MIGKFTPEWSILKSWLNTKISDAHANMERGLNPEEYNFARGQIAICKALIEDVEPTTPPQTSEDDYGISAPYEAVE